MLMYSQNGEISMVQNLFDYCKYKILPVSENLLLYHFNAFFQKWTSFRFSFWCRYQGKFFVALLAVR